MKIVWHFESYYHSILKDTLLCRSKSNHFPEPAYMPSCVVLHNRCDKRKEIKKRKKINLILFKFGNFHTKVLSNAGAVHYSVYLFQIILGNIITTTRFVKIKFMPEQHYPNRKHHLNLFEIKGKQECLSALCRASFVDVYLAYLKSYGHLKIVKCIGMY